jgi:hypothetical protein
VTERGEPLMEDRPAGADPEPALEPRRPINWLAIALVLAWLAAMALWFLVPWPWLRP